MRKGSPVIPAVVALAATALAGCGLTGEGSARGGSGDGEVRVVTTTNFITDTAREIAGERASVEALMGPGVDPHL
jgi:manganese/zinc/iron transport system substrate-binding protein